MNSAVVRCVGNECSVNRGEVFSRGWLTQEAIKGTKPIPHTFTIYKVRQGTFD